MAIKYVIKKDKKYVGAVADYTTKIENAHLWHCKTHALEVVYKDEKVVKVNVQVTERGD